MSTKNVEYPKSYRELGGQHQNDNSKVISKGKKEKFRTSRMMQLENNSPDPSTPSISKKAQ